MARTPPEKANTLERVVRLTLLYVIAASCCRPAQHPPLSRLDLVSVRL